MKLDRHLMLTSPYIAKHDYIPEYDYISEGIMHICTHIYISVYVCSLHPYFKKALCNKRTFHFIPLHLLLYKCFNSKRSCFSSSIEPFILICLVCICFLFIFMSIDVYVAFLYVPCKSSHTLNGSLNFKFQISIFS